VGLLSVSAESSGAKALFYTESGTTFTAPNKVSGTPSTSKPSAPSRTAQKRPELAPQAEPGVWYGLGYWVELKRGNVVTRIADPTNFDFRSGDRIRFQVMANTQGYLYIVNRGSSGQEALLFPTTPYTSNWLEARKPYAVPQNSWILFDDQPGEENLLLVLSPKPLVESVSESAPSSTLPPATPVRFTEVTMPCGTKDLMVCGAKDLMVERDEVQGQQATYVGGVVRTSAETPEQFSLIAHRVRLLHR
jgi:hypothetical protein